MSPTPRTQVWTRWLPWAGLLLAFLAGIVVFADYFFPQRFLADLAQGLLKITLLVSGGAVMLTAFHLAWRHGRLARARYGPSLVLVGAFGLMFLAGLLPEGYMTGLGGWLFQWMLAPGMAALFALLPIFLAYALMRHLDLRDVGGMLLFVGMLAVLMGQVPLLTARVPFLAGLRYDMLIAPAGAAFRGVIMGLAIGITLSVLYRLVRRLI